MRKTLICLSGTLKNKKSTPVQRAYTLETLDIMDGLQYLHPSASLSPESGLYEDNMTHSILKRIKRLLDSHTSTGQAQGLAMLNDLNRYVHHANEVKTGFRIQDLKNISLKIDEVHSESAHYTNPSLGVLRSDVAIDIDKLLFPIESNLDAASAYDGLTRLDDWCTVSGEMRRDFLLEFHTQSAVDDLIYEIVTLIKGQLGTPTGRHLSLMIIKLLSPVSLKPTKRLLREVADSSSLIPESAEGNPEVENSIDDPSVKKETVQFHSEMEEGVAEAKSFIDSTRYAALTGDEDLGNFLSRPIIIDKRDLAIGSTLNASVNCWHKYLSKPTIARKIQNYRYIRGKLHLKFLINGGPAFYGKILVSYTPHDWIVSHEQGAEAHHRIQGSQRVHCILDPTESSGGEIICPFVYNRDYLDITLNEQTEVERFGQFHYHALYPLSNSQTTSARLINITCYAHMSQVELAAPTTVGVLPESALYAESSDEYGKGIISRPASAIAKYAGMLKKIPPIAPFATATELVASSVGQAAALFGYSRPVNIDPIRQYRPTYLGNLANTSIDEAVHKLSCDPKQGLTIDPRTIGIDIPGDELSVKQMISRFSIVDSFGWDPTAVNGSRLAVIPITPALAFQGTTSTGKFGRQLTPLHMVQNLFKYWRGTTKFRFIVNASKFHRGRLALVYYPDSIGATTMSDEVSAQAYTRIVDISETRDFEIDVSWFQQEPFKETKATMSNSVDMYHSPTDNGTVVSPTYFSSECNGTLVVYVVNELTNLNEESITEGQVGVTWGVSGCPDYIFGEPTHEMLDGLSFSEPITVNFLRADSGLWAESAAVESSDSADHATGMISEQLESVGRPTDYPAQNLVNFGEDFDSLRALCKRYVYYASYFNPSPGVGSAPFDEQYLWRIRNANFPSRYGHDDQVGMYQNRAVAATPTTELFTPHMLPPFVYLAEAFLAQRGGIRHKYTYAKMDHTVMFPSLMTVTRSHNDVSSLSFFSNINISLKSSNNDPVGKMQTMRNLHMNKRSLGGMAATNPTVNPTLEVEFPFYRNLRYDTKHTSRSSAYGDGHMLEMILPQKSDLDAGECMVSQFVATAEDFSLNWFVNAPVVWYQDYPTDGS